MINSDTAIRRTSFAEARHSVGEAMVAIAKHRAEHNQAVAALKASGDAAAEQHRADDEADRARDAARLVDKTA